MKKIICFLLFIIAFTTNAQTLIINGDDNYGDISVEVIINGVPINIGNVSKGQPLTYTIPSGTILESLEISASSQDAYVFVETNSNYYQLYLDWLSDTGTYFDNPENPYILDIFNSSVAYGIPNYNFFIGTLPKID